MKNSWKPKLVLGLVCLAAFVALLFVMSRTFFFGMADPVLFGTLGAAAVLAVVAAALLGFAWAEKKYRH